jgi:hypothetical protein
VLSESSGGQRSGEERHSNASPFPSFSKWIEDAMEEKEERSGASHSLRPERTPRRKKRSEQEEQEEESEATFKPLFSFPYASSPFSLPAPCSVPYYPSFLEASSNPEPMLEEAWVTVGDVSRSLKLLEKQGLLAQLPSSFLRNNSKPVGMPFSSPQLLGNASKKAKRRRGEEEGDEEPEEEEPTERNEALIDQQQQEQQQHHQQHQETLFQPPLFFSNDFSGEPNALVRLWLQCSHLPTPSPMGLFEMHLEISPRPEGQSVDTSTPLVRPLRREEEGEKKKGGRTRRRRSSRLQQTQTVSEQEEEEEEDEERRRRGQQRSQKSREPSSVSCLSPLSLSSSSSSIAPEMDLEATSSLPGSQESSSSL